MTRQDDMILVIDMQNVYRPGQPWGCRSFDRACRNIRKLLETSPSLVRFTKFVENPRPYGVWKEYNLVNREINGNPWMNAIADELSDFARRYPVLEKSVYSSMKIPEIRDAASGGRAVVLTGVVSECCVLSTCMGAIDLGVHVVYLRDACAGDGPDTEAAVENILSRLPLHVTLCDTADYIAMRRNEKTV